MLVTPLKIDGKLILVEVEEQRISLDLTGGPPEGSLEGVEDTIVKLSDFGESLLSTCTALYGAIERATREIKPEKVEVEFGLTLGGEMGIPFVAKGTAEANFKIRLTWPGTKSG